MHVFDAGGDDAVSALRSHMITAKRADDATQRRHGAHDLRGGEAVTVGEPVAGHEHVGYAVFQLEVCIVCVGAGQTQLRHHNRHKRFLEGLKQNKTAARELGGIAKARESGFETMQLLLTCPTARTVSQTASWYRRGAS